MVLNQGLFKMSLSTAAKFLITPVITSIAVFSMMTIPLVVCGDKQVSIKLQNESLFSGKLRDISTPYIVIATALSLGSGISAIAVYGWRNSSRKATKFEQQLSILEKDLKEKDKTLEEFKISESRFQVFGLDKFLDDGSSGESFLGYIQLNSNATDATVETTNKINKTVITQSEFEELQHQFREVMLQMQVIQNNLQLLPLSIHADVKASEHNLVNSVRSF